MTSIHKAWNFWRGKRVKIPHTLSVSVTSFVHISICCPMYSPCGSSHCKGQTTFYIPILNFSVKLSSLEGVEGQMFREPSWPISRSQKKWKEHLFLLFYYSISTQYTESLSFKISVQIPVADSDRLLTYVRPTGTVHGAAEREICTHEVADTERVCRILTLLPLHRNWVVF